MKSSLAPAPDRPLSLAALATLAVLAAVTASGCGTDESIVLEIRARPAVAPMHELTVTVSDDGEDAVSESYSLTGHTLPVTLTIATAGQSGEITAEVVGSDRDGIPVGRGRATTSFPTNGSASLVILLRPEDFVVNTTYGAAQDLVAVQRGFGARQAAAAGDESIVVVWESDGSAMGRLLGPTGQPRSNATTLTDAEFPLPRTPGVASLQGTATAACGATDCIVTWAELNDPSTEVYAQAMTAADGARKSDGAEVFVGGDFDPELLPVAIALADGSFAVLTLIPRDTFVDPRGTIVGRNVGSDGQVASSDYFQISRDTPGFDSAPHAAGLTSGGFVAVWSRQETGTAQVFGRLFSSIGLPLSEEIPISTGAGGNERHPSVVAAGDGGFLAAWVREVSGEEEAIMVRRFDNGGTPYDQPREIARFASSDGSPPALANRPSDSAIAVVWASRSDESADYDITFQLLLPDGSPTGEPRAVASADDEDQITPSVVPAADHSFLVLWTDNSQRPPDTELTAVRGRVIYP